MWTIIQKNFCSTIVKILSAPSCASALNIEKMPQKFKILQFFYDFSINFSPNRLEFKIMKIVFFCRAFLIIFEENFRIIQETPFANSKKIQNWVCNFILNQARNVHAKFQLFSFYLDGLRQIFDQFWRKF
jgi:hypothetical protein